MSADDARKLFVGGLGDSVTDQELRSVFESAGFEIEFLSVPRDRETGQLRGFAFVTLKTAEQAENARDRLTGVECGGRNITVREFSQGGAKPKGPPGPRAPEYSVFLGKLPFELTVDGLTSEFDRLGLNPPKRIVLPSNPDGRPRGFGFATLENKADVDAVIAALDGHNIMGRAIVVNEARAKESRPPGAGRNSDMPPSSYGGGGFGSGRPPAGGRSDYRGGSDTGSSYRGDSGPPPSIPGFGGGGSGGGFEQPDGAERRRRTEKKPAKDKKRGGSAAQATKKSEGRRRGGGSNWHQWETDDD